MRPILSLRKWLDGSRYVDLPSGIALRNYRDSRDAIAWARLQTDAFRDLTTKPRIWQGRDFEQMFLSQPWWNPDWMFFAELPGDDSSDPFFVGAVGLAKEPNYRWGHVRWLAVRPDWQRRGIARALLAALETCAWRDGVHELRLDTLPTWEAAVAFYRASGFSPCDMS